MVVGYYRNWYFNHRVTDNLAVSPADYSPFSITAPVDPRLPGGGGNRISGLYDLSPAKVGQVDNLETQASNFGTRKIINDFLGVNFQTRFGSGIQLGGGIDGGRSVTDNCFVVDSPQQLLFCRVVTSFKDQTQLKVHGSYPLPAGFVVSAILNNTPGPVLLANYTVTRAQIQGLDRPLSTSSRSVPLIDPNTNLREPRIRSVDVKISNTIRMGRYRLRPNLGLYNALNNSPIIRRNNTYGPLWGPEETLGGRLLQFSAELTF